MNNNFQKKLIQSVKDAGQEIVDNAEDFVGSGNMLRDMTITIRFDPEIDMCLLTIDMDKTYLCKRAYDRFREGVKNEE